MSAQPIAAFHVRIGLGAGEVIADDGDYHGVAVIEAARLEALARPGEILATDVVRLLGQRRSSVTFEAVGERTLKGLDHPVLVHRVIDQSGRGTPTLPRVLVADTFVPLVGRQHHVDRFQARWDDCKRGLAGLVLMRGQPGIGKTRLVSHCAALAHDDGALVLAGVCDSDLRVPYEPFAMAVRKLGALDATLKLAISDRTGALDRLFPGSTSSHSESQPVIARLELFDAVSALLHRLSRVQPVLLVIDDLQWASAPTVLMLRHLVQALGSQRVLIVATYREADLHASHPLNELLADLRLAPRTSVVDVDALTEADVVQMVLAIAPSSPIARVAEVAQLVHRESAGSPFFASELLRHLAATGRFDEAADSPGADRLAVPESVHEVITQRLARLAPSAHEVMTLAAVIGPTFDVDLLAAASGFEADDMLDLLDAAIRAGIVTEVGANEFAFIHAIVRTALLDELSATRLTRAHRRVAESLEMHRAEHFDELARHWQIAGDVSRATFHLARAARRDMIALAFESARSSYQQVIEVLNRDPRTTAVELAEAWLGFAAASRAVGHESYKQAVTRAARLARSARNGALMAEAAAMSTWPGMFFFIAELPDIELIELCEDALSLLAPTDPVRPRVLATLASHLTFASNGARRRELIDEARALAATHGDPLLTAEVLNAEFLCLREPETPHRREQISGELGRLARATGDPQVEFLSGFFAAYCRAECGDLEGSRRQLIDLAPVAVATRNQYFEFLVDRLVLSIDIARCAPETQTRIDGLLAQYKGTYADTDGTWALQTGLLAYHAGTLDQMLPSIQAMTTGAQARTWTAAQALALLWAGDRPAANEILDARVEIQRNYFWTTVIQARAEVAAGLGRLDHCQQMFDELAPYRGRLGVTGGGSMCFGLVSRTLGMLALALGDLPTAIDTLSESMRDADAIGTHADVGELIREALSTAQRHEFNREARLLLALSDELQRVADVQQLEDRTARS